MPHMLGLFCEKNMPIQQISLGARPKGEGGDTWREGSEKINGNFEDLDERVALAKSVADSKTTNATDAHLLNRSNHTGTQSISTILGLQVALDSAASQIDITGNAATATKLQTACTIGGVSFNGTANINLPGVNTAGNQSTSGNAATTTKLQTARSIAISGAVTGTSTSFDGSSDIAIATTAIDGSKISTGTIPAERIPTLNQNTTGNASTASKLGTARSVTFSGGATGSYNFDGSTNVVCELTVAPPVVSSIDASVITTGTLNTARIPTLNQNTSGNAATATKLATARNINGVVFDGTADIQIPSETFNATETTAGKAKIATTAIAQAGTNNTDFLTAKKLRDALNATGGAPIFACRAWVSFDASTGVIANLMGGNIASVVRSQEGMYTITFTTAMLNNNYAILCSIGDAASGFIRVIYRGTKSCIINTLNTSNILKDANFISIGVFC